MPTKGRGSLTVPKVEQSTRGQILIDVSCASDGVLLVKKCETDEDSNKIYEPLVIGRALAPSSDGEGNLSLTGIGGLINGDGTLILDDGANWRVTLVFWDGNLRDATVGASVGALASWVPFP